MAVRLILIILLLLHGCPAAADNVPTLRVDARHQAVGVSRPPPYIVRPTLALEVVADSYRFDVPIELRRHGIHGPNAVNVLIDRSHGYYVDWPRGASRCLLNVSTLRPMPGRLPFAGFRRGQVVVVGIGCLMAKGQGKKGFFPLWAGVANVH